MNSGLFLHFIIFMMLLSFVCIKETSAISNSYILTFRKYNREGCKPTEIYIIINPCQAVHEIKLLAHVIRGNSLTGTFTNSEYPDEIPHHAAFYQSLHCLHW